MSNADRKREYEMEDYRLSRRVFWERIFEAAIVQPDAAHTPKSAAERADMAVLEWEERFFPK